MHYLRIFSKIGSKLGVKNGNVVQKNVSSFVHLYRVLSIGGYWVYTTLHLEDKRFFGLGEGPGEP